MLVQRAASEGTEGSGRVQSVPMRAVKGSLGLSHKIEVYQIGRLSLGLMARFGVPVGGRVMKQRAVAEF